MLHWLRYGDGLAGLLRRNNPWKRYAFLDAEMKQMGVTPTREIRNGSKFYLAVIAAVVIMFSTTFAHQITGYWMLPVLVLVGVMVSWAAMEIGCLECFLTIRHHSAERSRIGHG